MLYFIAIILQIKGNSMQCFQILILSDDDSLQDKIQLAIPEEYFIKKNTPLEEDISLVILSASCIEEVNKIRNYNDKIPILVILEKRDITFALELFSSHITPYNKEEIDTINLPAIIKRIIKTQGKTLTFIQVKENYLEVSFPAEMLYLDILTHILHFLTFEFQEKEKRRLLYAFRELVQNAIEHGSSFSSEKNILVRYIKNNDYLSFYTEDQGDGFCFYSLPHASIGNKNKIDVAMYRKKHGMRPGGLGIGSVQGIADCLEYNEKGNAVTMIKYYPKKI